MTAILDTRNAILLERPRPPPTLHASPDCEPIGGYVVGNVHYRNGRELAILLVCLGQVKTEARPNQLITFARRIRETLTIEDRDLPAAGLDQARTFQFADSIRDAWPMDTQHFAEQTLRNRERVIVAAIAHHEQPTR